MTADLRKIVIFGHFTVLHISHPNELIFTFQVSCGQLVVIFIILKAFSESRKIEVFHDRGPAKKCQFWAFHSFAYFSTKWANIHISSVQWSSGGDFHHFKRLSRKSKNLKIFHDRGPAKNCFPDRGPAFFGISQFCIFLTQMSKYSHFKCPVVNWWWFSSF